MNTKHSNITNAITPTGKFVVEHWRRGEMINLYHIANGVTDQGKNAALGVNFHNDTQPLRWWMSLIDSVGYVELSDLDTYLGINTYVDGLTLPYWKYYWSYRKTITIDNTNVGADDLVNFPLCVRINSDTDLSSATATGSDIRFVAADGLTFLDHECEYWSGGNGTAVTAIFWVRIPTISHTDPTVIYVYYGNANAPDGSNVTDTWDSNYKGVWHLSDIATGYAGDFKDSTINSNNSLAIIKQQPTRIISEIGYGQYFHDYQNIVIPNNASLTVENLTLSVWVNPQSVDTGANIVGYDNGYVLEVSRVTGNKIGLYLYINVGWRYFDFQYPISLDAWTYIVVTYDGSTGDAVMYANGVYYNTINYAGPYPLSHSTGTGNAIGGYLYSLFYTGAIDEVRVSAAVATSDQINFEWRNTTSATNELTWSAQESLVALPGNNWMEFVDYTDFGNTNTRPLWDNDAVSGQAISNTIKTLFDATAAGVIKGIFLVGGGNSQIKGDDTAATLWATALFLLDDVILEASDQLRVIYTVNV